MSLWSNVYGIAVIYIATKTHAELDSGKCGNINKIGYLVDHFLAMQQPVLVVVEVD